MTSDNQTPLVSIVINNYNYGRYLQATIQSALSQQYSQLEIIVVDDGSTDNSRDIIAAFEGKIHPIMKPNGGQGSAFNTGYAESHGEIVLFLDSDDLLYSDAVQQIVNAWSKTFSKYQFPLRVIDEVGNRTGGLYPPKQLAKGDVLEELLATGSYPTAPTSGNAFSRKFLANVMPIPAKTWPSHADCYLIHLAPFFGHIGRHDAPLGEYRVHTNSLSLSTLIIKDKLSIDRLRFHVIREARQRELVADMASKMGRSMNPDTVLNGYTHYKCRFSSFKLAPIEHPFKEDTLLSLAGTLLKKVWKADNMRLPSKAAYAAWVFLVAALPKARVEWLIIQGISPENRKMTLARLVNAGDKVKGRVGQSQNKGRAKTELAR